MATGLDLRLMRKVKTTKLLLRLLLSQMMALSAKVMALKKYPLRLKKTKDKMVLQAKKSLMWLKATARKLMLEARTLLKV